MTIREILNRFLEELRPRLAPRSFDLYDQGIGFFQDCIDGYGHLFLDDAQRKHLEASMVQNIEYFDCFGPEELRDRLFSEFVGYFLPKKIACGRDSASKMCAAALNCYKWLCEKGYVQDELPNETVKELREDFREAWKHFNGESSVYDYV